MRCDTRVYSVGVVGARGYVGRALIELLDAHPSLETTLAVSRGLAGREVGEEFGVDTGALRFQESFDAGDGACPDILVLGLPNGRAAEMVRRIDGSGARPRLILDLSSDFRFDDGWVYSVPELHGAGASGAERIANPGCYATAMQLALEPIIGMLASTPHCFGVSGYSGAGTTPSERNDAETLRTGVLPYTLAGHTHEREVSRHLARRVRFAPSVAGYPRGITLTALVELTRPLPREELLGVYRDRYDGEPFVSVADGPPPRVQDVTGTPRAMVGGITVDAERPNHAAVVCVLDNLLKGAASQALQNINLALGLDHATGMTP